MICLTSDEIKVSQNLSCNQEPQIIFRGTICTERLCFSKNNRQFAVNFCQYYDEDNMLCLLVEHQRYFSVFVQNQTVLENTSSPKQHVQKTAKPASKNETNIERYFINYCQHQLANFIGPIASIVCQQTLSQNPEIDREEFVEALAKKIPDQKQKLEFKQQVLK